MKNSFPVCLGLGLLGSENSAVAIVLSAKFTKNVAGIYGNSACPCVGIDNLKGYFATQQDAYHVQYPADAGSSCSTWEMGMHPKCRGGYYDGPEWCRQSWCYVDPCNCHLDVMPKISFAGIKYQGLPAYWSYKTCGGIDLYSAEMNKDACIMQKSEAACSKNPDCAWNGKLCGGKEAMSMCKDVAKKDPAIFGQEDCRCVGLGGKHPGKAFMYINDQDFARYSPDVGATCKAWELDSHPACLKKDGQTPAWCSMKWCWVDPCKCKTKVPPTAVAGRNQDMVFQGKLAHWSAETCGNTDSWSSTNTSGQGVVDDAIERLCASPSIPSGAVGPAASMALLAVFKAIGMEWA